MCLCFSELICCTEFWSSFFPNLWLKALPSLPSLLWLSMGKRMESGDIKRQLCVSPVSLLILLLWGFVPMFLFCTLCVLAHLDP